MWEKILIIFENAPLFWLILIPILNWSNGKKTLSLFVMVYFISLTCLIWYQTLSLFLIFPLLLTLGEGTTLSVFFLLHYLNFWCWHTFYTFSVACDYNSDHASPSSYSAIFSLYWFWFFQHSHFWFPFQCHLILLHHFLHWHKYWRNICSFFTIENHQHKDQHVMEDDPG